MDSVKSSAYLCAKSSTKQLQKAINIGHIAQLGSTSILKTARALDCEISDLYSMPHSELSKLGWTEEQISKLKGPLVYEEKIRKWLDSDERHKIVCYRHDTFPSLLKQISQPPLYLFCIGDINLLNSNCLAVVGSRSVTKDAELNTRQLVNDICLNTNMTIVSGLAIGVDTIAHEVALKNSKNTIGVLGSGIDVIYPKQNSDLYESISRCGLLISEFLPTVKPRPEYFPRRNRIISGLSLGTLVSEAKMKSGSLITAKYALEQNREVFAMPGNIRNQNAKGCNWLIKQGAYLTDDWRDIVEQLSPSFGSLIQLQHSNNNQQIKKNTNQCLASDPLLDSVGYELTSIDLIAQRTGRSLPDLLAQLLEYELRGLVASTSEGYVKLGT